MKILHVSKYYPPEPGGIENFVADLAHAQVAQGHAVYVISHHPRFAAPGVVEKVRGVWLERVRTFGQAAYTPVSPGFFPRLSSAVSRFKPDVIHAHLPNVSAFWLLFMKKSCRLVLHWHADVVASFIDRKMAFFYTFYRPWESLLLNKADRVICTSNAYLQHSRALQKWKRKCTVIPLGLDPARMQLPGPPAGTGARSSPPFTVLSVGRFTYYKGFEYLVDAAQQVPDARFILVGNGPRHAAIKKRVAQKGLQGRVRLPGMVSGERLKALFAACDVFCLPSIERTEAFGLVLLEAMYFGKPLVTTRIAGSGVTEVNIHGQTGLQVPPADPGALADALNTLRRDPRTRSQMAFRARDRFVRYFHIRQVSRQIQQVLETP